jgi:hypothetical protein
MYFHISFSSAQLNRESKTGVGFKVFVNMTATFSTAELKEKGYKVIQLHGYVRFFFWGSV